MPTKTKTKTKPKTQAQPKKYGFLNVSEEIGEIMRVAANTGDKKVLLHFTTKILISGLKAEGYGELVKKQLVKKQLVKKL